MAEENLDAGQTVETPAATAEMSEPRESGETAAAANADEPDKAASHAAAGDAPQAAEADPDEAPITDWGKVDLQLDEGVEWDAGLLEQFGQQAVELGLTPKQARTLAQWQTRQVAEYRQARVDAGIAELRAEWGNKLPARQKSALAFVSQIDRKLQAANPKLGDKAFSRAIAKSGAACDANFVRGLWLMASMLEEDSIGQPHSGAGTVKPETPEEVFKELFPGKK